MRRLLGAVPAAALVKTFVFPHKLTLAWDLDGTLITHKTDVLPAASAEHTWASVSTAGRVYSFWRRPYAEAVLKVLAVANDQHLFTAASRLYADSIVDALYPNTFKTRLYREALVSTSCGKDLTRLGTPLDRTLLIDDQVRNRIGDQNFLFVNKYERREGMPESDRALVTVAVIVLAFNCIGASAFDVIRWLDLKVPSPQLLPPKAEAAK